MSIEKVTKLMEEEDKILIFYKIENRDRRQRVATKSLSKKLFWVMFNIFYYMHKSTCVILFFINAFTRCRWIYIFIFFVSFYIR